jgi:hypothetical protein
VTGFEKVLLALVLLIIVIPFLLPRSSECNTAEDALAARCDFTQENDHAPH